MDDTQIPASPAGGSNQPGGSVDQPMNSASVSNQPPVPVSPSPVSPPQKEQEGVPLSEPLIIPTETEPVLHPEVEEAGVEKVSEAPVLTVEQQEAGLKFSKESVPVPTQPTSTVQLPMTQQQAQNILKMHKKVSESITWLATLVLKHLKMMHQKITS